MTTLHGTLTTVGDPARCELEDAVVPVHYLLTGQAQSGDGPLSFLVGNDPVRVFAATSVAAIADAVESIAARLVHARLSSAGLAALPPFEGRALDDDDKEWLLAVLQGVMTFMRRAATERAAVEVALHPPAP